MSFWSRFKYWLRHGRWIRRPWPEMSYKDMKSIARLYGVPVPRVWFGKKKLLRKAIINYIDNGL